MHVTVQLKVKSKTAATRESELTKGMADDLFEKDSQSESILYEVLLIQEENVMHTVTGDVKLIEYGLQ